MRILIVALLVLTLSAMAGDFVSGSTACPSSGAVQVSSNTYNLYELTVSANIANTGKIYLGGTTVNTSSGGVLVPGASYTATKPSAGVNPKTLYFACSVNTDGITWIGSR